MTKKFAELNLYMGICDNRGFGEGRFDKKKADKYYQKIYLEAIMHVRRQIDLFVQGEKSALGYGYFKIVEDEFEARKLIDYAERHIPGAGETIELIDSMHGKIRFYRNIQFEGAIKRNRNKLIDMINKSGMGPIRDPKEYGTPYCWERALKFH